MTQRTYLAIDLKSYYASAECAARHLDPLTTNLVVADASRTEKTICLAVSPSLKSYGIPGRARLFEVVQRVKEVNSGRLRDAIRNKTAVYKDGVPSLAAASYDATALAADPSLEVSYLVAPPRMAYYEKVSRQIYGIYLKYIAPEDIVVYSIDEVFIDATAYLTHYKMSAHDLAMTMIREVLYTTGITATAGIGTNLYLAKLAMDITAKHAAPDKDGVRIAGLDEESFRYLLWDHKPLTDFWQTGPGTVRRLEKHGIHTMGELARASIHFPEILYKEFGIDAEILIDHAWGLEPCGMKEINAYFKKHATALGCPGLSDAEAAKLDERVQNSYSWEKQPYPSYILSGNTAEMRRLRQRIEEVSRTQNTEYVGWDFPGGHAEADKEDNRLRLYFDGKPTEEQRSKLKYNGFKWAPSVGAWQRQLNDNAIYAASRLDFLRPESGESPTALQPKAPAKSTPERG